MFLGWVLVMCISNKFLRTTGLYDCAYLLILPLIHSYSGAKEYWNTQNYITNSAYVHTSLQRGYRACIVFSGVKAQRTGTGACWPMLNLSHFPPLESKPIRIPSLDKGENDIGERYSNYYRIPRQHRFYFKNPVCKQTESWTGAKASVWSKALCIQVYTKEKGDMSWSPSPLHVFIQQLTYKCLCARH